MNLNKYKNTKLKHWIMIFGLAMQFMIVYTCFEIYHVLQGYNRLDMIILNIPWIIVYYFVIMWMRKYQKKGCITLNEMIEKVTCHITPMKKN